MKKKPATEQACEQKKNKKLRSNTQGLKPGNNKSNLLLSLSQQTTFRDSDPIPTYKNRIIEKELLNGQRDLNQHFCKVSSKLCIGAIYYGKIVVREDYVFFDFSFLAEWFNAINQLKVIPWQLSVLGKKFISTNRTSEAKQKNYHTITKTEVLGRLIYCGFKIIETEEQNNVLSFKARKVSRPDSSVINASSLLYTANRVGKDGKNIKVYKLRTMHPYAEFLQSYVYEQNDLDVGGKFKDDFRISKRGKFLRKYFFDEMPMIWNLIRGDIKLVGVRPISRHYLSLYDEAFQQVRNKAKPGLLPPFYVDFPDSIEKIQMSELNYLEQYQLNPCLTDVRYFFLIVYNIIFGRVRSQ